MTQFQSKQTEKPLAAFVLVNNISLGVGITSINITAPLNSALGSAGFNNKPVPLVPFQGSNKQGVVVLTPHNRVEFVNHATKERLVDADGYEVFGRMIYSAGVYTIYFFSKVVNNIEQAVAIPAAQFVDLEVVYMFSFRSVPAAAAVSTRTRNIHDDPNAVLVLSKGLVNTPSITWVYDAINNKLRGNVDPAAIQALFKFNRIRFRVGNIGWPDVGETTFTLHTCDGAPVVNHVVIYMRERDEQWEVDDFTYDKTTGLVTVIHPFLVNERNIFYTFPEWLWILCNGSDTASSAGAIMLSDDEVILLSPDEAVLYTD